MNELTIAVFSFSGHQDLLPYCLRSIYSHAPPHKEIILVWDDSIDWYPIDFDQLRRQTGVDFRLVLQSQICRWPDSIVRWGWIKQQLAKIYCWKYVTTEYTWIVDGDVLLTGSADLFDGHHPILRYDQEKFVSDDYKFFMKKYLGIDHFHEHTFVGSTALWQNSVCLQLDELCLAQSGMRLLDAVDHMLMQGDHPALPFSEFEYYGHYIWTVSGSQPRLKNWNYVPYERNWLQPIQIMWHTKQNIPITDRAELDQRYSALLSGRCPD